MSRSSRQQLRRVEALGARVEVRNGGRELAGEFHALYRAFVRAKGHTRPLSARRVSEYLEVSDVWLISIDDQPVCGRMILRDEDVGRVRNLYEANCRFRDTEMARLNSSLNRYLDWQAMRHYRDRGFVTWDWGGIGAHQKGAGKSYKRSMGGELREDRSYVLASGVGRQAYASSLAFAEPTPRPFSILMAAFDVHLAGHWWGQFGRDANFEMAPFVLRYS